MSKAIAKITVRCPHCSAQQQEPALAKSTFCRRCSEYFAISASTMADAPLPGAPAPKAAAPANTWSRASAPVPDALAAPPVPQFGTTKQPLSPRGPVAPPSPPPKPNEAASGLLGKIEGLFGSKPKIQIAHCFECTGWHEVSSSAQSSTCKACGAYIDLQDYKVSGSFSRNIKTRGNVYLSAKGDLSSSKIICSNATIHGKMRGNLTCAGRVTIRVHGKIFGSVEAGELVVEKGSEVAFTRPVHAATAEIHGRMSALIVANGQVTISKSGLLDGAVSATGFSVEKGGCFQGELTITPRQVATSPTSSSEPQISNPAVGMAGLGPVPDGEQSPAMG